MNKHFWTRSCMGVETWVYELEKQTSIQLVKWRGKKQMPWHRHQKSRCCLLLFFHNRGLIHLIFSAKIRHNYCYICVKNRQNCRRTHNWFCTLIKRERAQFQPNLCPKCNNYHQLTRFSPIRVFPSTKIKIASPFLLIQWHKVKFVEKTEGLSKNCI